MKRLGGMGIMGSDSLCRGRIRGGRSMPQLNGALVAGDGALARGMARGIGR